VPKILAGPTPRPNWPVGLAPCDVVLNGMTGSIGLAPTLAALDAGRTLALANKESLVAGGRWSRRPCSARARSCRSTRSTRPWPQCLRGGGATRSVGWC
jgi:1-deoxy-D-xylulose-5-phosphate reductoisomerase